MNKEKNCKVGKKQSSKNVMILDAILFNVIKQRVFYYNSIFLGEFKKKITTYHEKISS